MNKEVQLRAFLMCGIAAATLCSKPAMAQSASGAAERADASPIRADGSRVQEIVVTARKKAERLQDVPVAITAVSGETFAASNALDIKEIAKVSPGVYYQASDPSKPRIYIRGIGTRGFSSESDPSVGSFVDGVYLGRFAAMVQDLDDVEHVEVLKGPQGTLFGRNTIAGALNIVTASPTDEFHFRVKGSYGFNQHFGGRQSTLAATMSGPIAPELTGLISVSTSRADGPSRVVNLDKFADGGGRTTVRARLDWKPSDNLKLDLNGDYYVTNGVSFEYRANDVGGLRPKTFGLRPGLVAPPVSPNPFLLYENPAPGTGAEHLHGGGVALTANYSHSAFDFTSITAYRHSYVDINPDIGASPFDILLNPYFENAHQFSQEFRLSSAKGGPLSMGGRLDWMIGAYYFEERSHQIVGQNFGPDFVLVFLPPPTGTGGVPITAYADAHVATNSYAFFGTATYRFTDALSLDVGLRYTNDRKSDRMINFTSAPGVFSSNFDLVAGKTWTSVDPSVTLSYKITPEVMTYASYSTGFKSGAFQLYPVTPLLAAQIADPEKVKAYQAGLKSELMDHRLRLNIAAFYYHYAGIQVQRSVLAPGSTTTLITSVTNAALAKPYGVEVEGQFAATENLRFDYGYAYLHAKYAQYQFTPTISFNGNWLPGASEHTADIGATLDIPTSFGKFTARASGNYRSAYYFEPSNADPGIREPAHFTADASLDAHVDQYSVGVYVRNLTGEKIRSGSLNLNPNRLLETWDYPRVIGIRASAKW